MQSDPGPALLRFLTCGSVDDGKSTLIGRLLHDSGCVPDDELVRLHRDSGRPGSAGEGLDFSLLVDGLSAEREQGITIDVAYRYFATARRRFIVADTPGHEQYTRNMATGASNASLAVILVDARKGVLVQTQRHSRIASLMGIRHIVLAVNKIDLVEDPEAAHKAIVEDYRAFAADLPFEEIVAIPLSARFGDNLARPSARLAWYRGPTLLEHLETVKTDTVGESRPFRMPVQWINRPHLDFRGYSGTVAGGRISVGDPVAVVPGGRTSTIRSIVTFDGERQTTSAGEAVTLVLADEIDVSRGDIMCAARSRPEAASQFRAQLVWMAEDPLIPGRPYWMKIGTRTVGASVSRIKSIADVTNPQQQLAATALTLNDIGIINLATREAIAFDPYAENRTTGAFILIDRANNQTVGAGMIEFALQRATNVHWQAIDLDKNERAKAKGQKPALLWFTGLSGSGKSTVANALERRLHGLGHHTYLLDGDNLRSGLNRDLGFTEVDRVENIRRVAEVAKLMVDAGLLVLASFISPFRAERQMARELMDRGEFVEIFVDAPLATVEERDPKGLYRKARAGEISNFTGIDSPYEAPETPDIRLRTDRQSVDEAVEDVLVELRRRGLVA